MSVSDGSADHFYFSSRHIKKMFSLACDTDSYFLYSPSTHLQLHAVHSINSFFFSFLRLCEVFGSPFKWRSCILGCFGLRRVCLWACARCFVHGSISMSLPYLPFTDKVSTEDRSPLSLCASPNCRLAFPIFLPKGQQEHISHICERSSSFLSLPCLPYMHTLPIL